MPTAITKTEKDLIPFDVNLEILPDILSYNQLAEKLKESDADPKVADMTFRFGTKERGTFLGLKRGEKRPVIKPEMIRKHEFIYQKLRRIGGSFYDFFLPDSFEIEAWKSHVEAVNQLKSILLKDPNAIHYQKIGATEYFCNRLTEFMPLTNESIASIVKIAGVGLMKWSGLTPGEIGKIKFPKKCVYTMCINHKPAYILKKLYTF